MEKKIWGKSLAMLPRLATLPCRKSFFEEGVANLLVMLPTKTRQPLLDQMIRAINYNIQGFLLLNYCLYVDLAVCSSSATTQGLVLKIDQQFSYAGGQAML